MILLLIRYFLAGILFIVTFPFFISLYILRFHHPDNAYWFNHIMSPLLLKLFGVKLEVRGQFKTSYKLPQVYIANHQTNLDMIIAGQLFRKNCRVIGKKSLIWIPVFGWLYYMSGQIIIDRNNNKKAVKKFSEIESNIRDKKVSALIFPEGTRSQEKALGPFKKGAFYAAIKSKAPLQPFVISTYAKKCNFKKWRSCHIITEILDPISTENHTLAQVNDLIGYTRNIFLTKIQQLDLNSARLK